MSSSEEICYPISTRFHGISTIERPLNRVGVARREAQERWLPNRSAPSRRLRVQSCGGWLRRAGSWTHLESDGRMLACQRPKVSAPVD